MSLITRLYRLLFPPRCIVCGMDAFNPQHLPGCPDDCGAHDFRVA